MSVLIRDMEMPKDCSCCFFCLQEEDVTFEAPCHCVITGNYIDCPENICPLVGIPEHGRLIDADEMCKDLRTVNPVYKRMIDWAIGVTNAQSTVLTADDRVEK